MPGDDEQSDGKLDGDVEQRTVAADQEAGKDGEAGRTEDGSQRDIAAEHEDQREDGDGGQSGQGSGDQEYTEASGDAPAATEAEPDREDVTEDGKEGGQRLEVAKRTMRQKQDADKAAKPDSCRSFEHVEQKSDCAQALAAGAKDIGCADVAAAGLTDVLVAEEADKQVPGGTRPEEISTDHDEEACEDHTD